MIEWQESYAIGVDELDQQHKNLFQYCNDLEEGINRGVTSKQTLDVALRFLGNYVKEHFGKEETCMYRCICPIAEKNAVAHQKFIEAFQRFQQKINDNADITLTLKELHHFLETWLVEHICKIDVQLKPFIQKSP